MQPPVCSALPGGLRGPAGAHAGLPAGTVVPLAAGGVAEDLVGLGDLPEAPRGVGVLGVGIGMRIVGQAPVRTGDLIVAGTRQHPQPSVQRITIAVSVWQSLSEL